MPFFYLPIQMLRSGHFFPSPVLALTAPSFMLLSPLGERLGEGDFSARTPFPSRRPSPPPCFAWGPFLSHCVGEDT